MPDSELPDVGHPVRFVPQRHAGAVLRILRGGETILTITTEHLTKITATPPTVGSTHAPFGAQVKHRSDVTAHEVDACLRQRWRSHVDKGLRDQLVDLLVINDNGMRAWVFAVLEKLHGRQQFLLRAVKSLVYMNDSPQADFVQSTIAEACRDLPKCLDEQATERSISYINSLTQLVNEDTCEDDATRMNQQNLLRQHGIHTLLHDKVLLAALARKQNAKQVADGASFTSALVEYDATDAKREAEVQREEMDDVLRATFNFFAHFCAANSRNQMEMQAIADVMWEHFMGQGLGTAQACSAIYKDNRALSVELEEEHITGQVKLCRDVVLGSEKLSRRAGTKVGYQIDETQVSEGAGRYPIFLRSIVRCNGMPIRVNQDRIMKAIMDNQDCLDTPFWQDDTDETHICLNLTNLITATRSRQNENDPESRLSYHVELMTLLAACVEGDNENCARKLRQRFPLNLLTTAIKSEELHDRVRAAYMLMCDTLYVSACASSPGLAKEFYLNNNRSPNEDALRDLGSALETSLRLLQRDEPTRALASSSCEHLFPVQGTKGGAVSFISSVFDSHIFEALEDRLPGTFMEFFGRIIEPVVVVNSLCELMKALHEVDPECKPEWNEVCCMAVSALTISSHFDLGSKVSCAIYSIGL